jgi:hypothetical protein
MVDEPKINKLVFSRFVLCTKRLKPFTALIQVIAIIVTAILAIEQFHTSNKQAKIANTLAFLRDMQASEFHEAYIESLGWFENSLLKKSANNPPPTSIERKIEHVLNRYSVLGILYRKDVLDRETIEAAEGIQIAQFWFMTTKVLTSEQLLGYENIKVFYAELKKCPAINEALKQLEEELKCLSPQATH